MLCNWRKRENTFSKPTRLCIESMKSTQLSFLFFRQIWKILFYFYFTVLQRLNVVIAAQKEQRIKKTRRNFLLSPSTSVNISHFFHCSFSLWNREWQPPLLGSFVYFAWHSLCVCVCLFFFKHFFRVENKWAKNKYIFGCVYLLTVACVRSSVVIDTHFTSFFFFVRLNVCLYLCKAIWCEPYLIFRPCIFISFAFFVVDSEWK